MNPKTDDKNVELRRLVGHLRDHLDICCLIGLNVDALKRSSMSDALLGHLQQSAQEESALIICKIFETSQRNDLNSIPGIIESLRPVSLDVRQVAEFETFGKQYGNCSRPAEGKTFLHATYGLFYGIHSLEFERLKQFRDKIGAHSESNVQMKFLPSIEIFEAFFNFANDFYRLVSQSLHEIEPAEVDPKVKRGFVRLMKSMGIENPKVDFR